MTLEDLNLVSGEEARQALLSCCGSSRWATTLAASRPFSNSHKLHDKAEGLWRAAPTEDWLEAFSKHPKIGDKSEAKWSAQEQSGMNGIAAGIAREMRDLNFEYERKFGYIFIICASGKPAEEMLAALKIRISNDPQDEIMIAAAEQAKIMHLRLEKLLAE